MWIRQFRSVFSTKAPGDKLLTTENRLEPIAGIRILKPSGATASNFQNVVGVVDRRDFGLSRDGLLAVLRAENVAAGRDFHPANHRLSHFSKATTVAPGQLHNTEWAAQNTFQLPIGARVTTDHIEQICEVIGQAHIHSASTRPASRSAGAA